MDNDEVMRRGAEAERLLNHELMQEAFATIDAEILTAWRKATKTEVREDLHRRAQLLDQVKGYLRTVATTGEMKRRELNELGGKRGFSL